MKKIVRWVKRKIYSNGWLLRILRDRSMFNFFQTKGIHVGPIHYYSPIPDTLALSDKLFIKKKHTSAIDWNDAEQHQHCGKFVSYKPEYSKFPFEKTPVLHEYNWYNTGFMCFDAVALYGMIRSYKPRRMIEIGGGNSTKLSAAAILENEKEGKPCELTCIEPYPSGFLQTGFKGLSTLIQSTAQDVSISEYQRLKEGDFLFIDSSHILKIGSDVEFYFSELLPQLNKGVIIHFHDIYLPEEYPHAWVIDRNMFFNEQYILQAFLSFNNAFKILFAARYFELNNNDAIRTALDFYPEPITASGSFWIQKVK